MAFFIIFCSCGNKHEIKLKSPDGNKIITFFPKSKETNEGKITFSVKYNEHEFLLPSVLNIQSSDLDLSKNFSVEKVEKTTVKKTWRNKIGALSRVPDNYNQVKIYLKSSKSKLNILCRVYNEGVAFSYEIPIQKNYKKINIDDEEITWNFDKDYNVWSTPKREPRVLTAQGEYHRIPLSKLKVGCERPLVVEISSNQIIALAEAKLVDFARLSFNSSRGSNNTIISNLDGNIEKVEQDKKTGAVKNLRSHNSKVEINLPFNSPWRVIMMAKNCGKLLEHNYILENLNDSCKIEDTLWITPGKVLREGTLTTKGGLAAVDFVASHNMQYVHFDAGWYGNEMDNKSDATTITLDPKRSKGPFDLAKICAYARSKNVKVMVYVNRRALEKQLDDLLPLYKKWGVSGIKFGFVRVGDQKATKWLHDAIKKVAKYHMVVDVHDEYRPTGFSRTYPNLLSQEGIRGDETSAPNSHCLITIFTRCLAGAADNTVCYYNKRVEKMGSHASQLAKTVCIYSPLQFLYWYDNAPSSPIKDDALWGNTNIIGNEPELEFFNNVPTTWDETKVLVGEIGKIAVIARRRGDDWWIGGINGELPKNIKLDFSFLDIAKEYIAKIYSDDNSIKTRTHVKIENKKLNHESSLEIKVKANNGFAMHIKPVE